MQINQSKPCLHTRSFKAVGDNTDAGLIRDFAPVPRDPLVNIES